MHTDPLRSGPMAPTTAADYAWEQHRAVPQAPAFSLGEDAATDTPEATDELKTAFHDFVGQTFFGEMIKAYRSSQQPSKYFNGGRAEEIFQGQFDQVLTEKLSEASASKIAEPMYDLFMLKRTS
jgi:flagellar protein FlgJ